MENSTIQEIIDKSRELEGQNLKCLDIGCKFPNFVFELAENNSNFSQFNTIDKSKESMLISQRIRVTNEMVLDDELWDIYSLSYKRYEIKSDFFNSFDFQINEIENWQPKYENHYNLIVLSNIFHFIKTKKESEIIAERIVSALSTNGKIYFDAANEKHSYFGKSDKTTYNTEDISKIFPNMVVDHGIYPKEGKTICYLSKNKE